MPPRPPRRVSPNRRPAPLKASPVSPETLSGGAAGVADSIAGAAEGVSSSAIDWAGQVVPDVTAAVGGANPSM